MRNIVPHGFVVLCLLLLSSLPEVSQAGNCESVPAVDSFDFLGRDLEDADKFLADYRGKVVVVTFWETWCKPCREELPLLDTLQRHVGKDRLEVVAINYSESKKLVKRFSKAWDIPSVITFTHRYDRDKRGTYKVTGMPTTFLFDKEGELQDSSCGYGEQSLNPLLNKLLTLI